MINYADQAKFKQDSIVKSLSITGSGVSIGNSNMDGENFSIEEVLNSGRELNFGECNSAKLSFSCGYYNQSIVGVKLTAKTTPDGASSAFQYGKYKVLSDEPTADRKWRDVVAYDELYDVLKFDVAGWWNSYLETDRTLKQVRDSFFSIFNITQDSVTLPNDSVTIHKTDDFKTLSGKSVLYAICQMNGRFGRIGRNGNFQYVKLAVPAEGLFPSNTLYPSDTLYPRAYGFEDNPIADGGKYISCKYEDYLIQVIDKLIIKTAEDDTGVTIGTGNNPYIIQNNFLLFGKNATELTTIGTNIYNEISGVWYRPCVIEAVGNPCLECGDGIRLHTVDGKDIDTIILKRKLKGIQSLKDNYVADGVKKRENDPNSTQAQINQTQGSVRQVKADLIEAQRIIAEEIQADRARIYDLEVTRATIQQLNAVDAKIDNLTAIAITTQNLSSQTISASQITTGTLDASRITVTNLSASSISSGIMSASRIADANGLAQYTGWYNTSLVWDVVTTGTATVYGPVPGHPEQMTTYEVVTGIHPEKHYLAILKGSDVT